MRKFMAIKRKDVKPEDCWDLSSLCRNQEEWKEKYELFNLKIIPKTTEFSQRLDDKKILLEALKYFANAVRELEIIHSYAFLNYETDGGNDEFQNMRSLSGNLISRFYSSFSYFDPEVLKQDEKYLKDCIEDEEFQDYKVYLERLLHQKPYILSEKEEKLLSLSSEALSTTSKAFQILDNVDFRFSPVFDRELTHSNYQTFLLDNDEKVRKEAYFNYYKTYRDHENTLATLYQGSVNKDIFTSRARGFNSSLEAALYPDNVSKSVYTALINEVNNGLDTLHRYYALLAKRLNKTKLKHYDVYLPLSKNISFDLSYDDAVTLIGNAIEPLGEEYKNILIKGLTTERWVDKYENEGKRSGAFSAGCYTGKPYILTNYDRRLVRSVSTLIHEGGHSMHSYYSKNNNPILSYDYSIFEAEVASTFNEELLSNYMINNAKTKEEKSYLISSKLSNLVATLFRQTMFAEFEMNIHEKVENGMMATLGMLKGEYKNLLEKYFGPQVEFEEFSPLEGLRIPHFYNAFYVYKYATGISAAIALSEKVSNGTEKDRNNYISFLKSGGSLFPIQSLLKAGVDMSKPEPIRAAIDKFGKLLNEFEAL